MIPFRTARFLASILKSAEFAPLKTDRGNLMPEIAFVGKSNVGKSTLINTLLNDRKLAKTSSTPGKTQRINLFLVDEKLILIDLPGYGYSKAAKSEISKWSDAIETFLNERATLKLLLLLIDSRRGPSEEDLSLIEWAQAKQLPVAAIFTKSDKLSSAENEQTLKKGRSILPSEIDILSFSKADIGAKKQLIQLINRNIKWD